MEGRIILKKTAGERGESVWDVGAPAIKFTTVQRGIHEKLLLHKEIELSLDELMEEETDQWHLQEHMK